MHHVRAHRRVPVCEQLERRVLLTGTSVGGGSWFEVVPQLLSRSGVAAASVGPQLPGSEPTTTVTQSGDGPDAAQSGVGPDATGSRWIVRLADAAIANMPSPQAADRLLGDWGVRVLQGLGQPGMLLVEARGTVEQTKKALRANPDVAYFERDSAVTGQVDPVLDQAEIPDGLAQIHVEEAWQQSQGSYSVVVGVLDTGIDLTHPDLYRNIWLNQGEIPADLPLEDVDGDGLITFHDLNDRQSENAAFVSDLNGNGYVDAEDLLADPTWADFVDSDDNGFVDDLVGWDFHNNDNDPSDDHRHGTHVAGTIGATANNEGVVGVNWRTSLMSLKLLDQHNRGATSTAALAFNYATMMRQQHDVNVRVTNNSFVGTEFSIGLHDAVAATRDADILLVAAAGNGDLFGEGVDLDDSPRYPASYDFDNIIAVAASTSQDELATFSNFGACLGQACSVDIAAPGVGVVSTTLPTDGNRVASRNGTSMAAPHVAGVAALVFSDPNHATASMAEVREAILSSVTPAEDLADRIASGGILNAAAALRATTFAPQPTLLSSPRLIDSSQALTLHVRYQDEDGVQLESLDANDLLVERVGYPGLPLDLQVKNVDATDVTSVEVTYEVIPTNRLGDHTSPVWGATDNGQYQVWLQPGEIRDDRNISNARRALSAGDAGFGFEVAISDPQVIFVNALYDNSDAVESSEPIVTLRDAVLRANVMSPQPVTIVLPPGAYAINDEGRGEDLSLTGDFDILGNATVLGTDPETTTIDANGLDRVFDIHPGGSLTLSGVSVHSGDADDGGAIRNDQGNLHLDHAVIERNVSRNAGGGIWSSGTLAVVSSLIAENETTSQLGIGGGGIYSRGALIVDGSTIANNTSRGGFVGDGGGGGLLLDTVAGQAQIINSTISGNVAAIGHGGGINQTNGVVEVLHATITQNLAPIGTGGGIIVGGAAGEIINSIVSNNDAKGGVNVSGEFLVAGANLIDVDPHLGPLADNGGPTLTHALLAGSPAINAGLKIVDVDQRGISRPDDGSLLRQSLGAVQSHFVEIRGRLFHDSDGDGVRRTSETALVGWTVFADLNDNQVLDSGEPFAITQLDDPGTPGLDESEYVLGRVDPNLGNVTVRVVPQPGFIESTPLVMNVEIVPAQHEVVSTAAPIRPIFHLDFSTTNGQLADVSEQRLPIESGSSVATLVGGGPTLENGAQLDAGVWSAADDATNEIKILDHPDLDRTSRDGGAVVTWVRVESDSEWNGILHADLTPTSGFDLTANGTSGLFGSVQGWTTNGFGPDHSSNGGAGGSETPAQQWVHVAMSWNRDGDHTIFVNGIPGSTIQGVGDQSFGLNDLGDWTIGGNGNQSGVSADDPNGQRLRGRLADFAIFDVPLNQGLINDIIRNGIPRPIEPIFHLDFSADSSDLADRSHASLPIEVGAAVSTIVGGGPVLPSGRQLDSAMFDGTSGNEIVIPDHPVLDAVSRSAGAIVSWIKVEDDREWNSIVKTFCAGHALECDAFSETRGIEVQANQSSGVFGAVQGWGTNNFGPTHATNDGPGGTETPSSVWTHVALTWSQGGAHTIYVNGVPGKTEQRPAVRDDPFGKNDPHNWTIGGDGLDRPVSGDDNLRRLRGQLADFAIFPGELSRMAIHEIMANGVAHGNAETDTVLGRELRPFETFGQEPSIVGQRVVFEDHLGRLLVWDAGAQSITPMIGINSRSANVGLPFADGESTAFDGEYAAFTGRDGQAVAGIHVVDQFGTVAKVVDRNSDTVFLDQEFVVHSIDNELVAFGVTGPPIPNRTGDSIFRPGKNRLGLFVGLDGEIAQLETDVGDPGDEVTFGSVQLDRTTSEYVFSASFGQDGGDFGVYATSVEGSPEVLVTQGTPIPNGNGSFVEIESFLVSDGQLAFRGLGDDGQDGIYLRTSDDEISVVADASTVIPGTESDHFDRFGNIAHDKGTIALVGMQRFPESARQQGVYRNLGIYVSVPGEPLRKVVDLHDQWPQWQGRTLRELSIGPQALSGNRLVYFAAFDDGSEGIFVIEFVARSEHVVTLEPGGHVANVDFGRRALPGSIEGYAFHDANLDGGKDSNEVGLPGFIVFLDQNANGNLDRDEPSTTTDEVGKYAFASLPSLVDYNVVAIPTMEWTPAIIPGLEPTRAVSLSADERVRNIEFGYRVAPDLKGVGNEGSIRITVFEDANSNGLREASEALATNQTVYADINRNTHFDEGLDVSAIERLDGTYQISNLGLRPYDVRVESRDGAVQTTSLGNAFQSREVYQLADAPGAIMASDLDRDGIAELIVASFDTNQISIVSDTIQRTMDSGGFGPSALLTTDINGDAVVDLVVANSLWNRQRPSNVAVFLGQGSGLFDEPTIHDVGEGPFSIVASDFDGDGDLDLASANSVAENVTIILNNATLGFESYSVPLAGRPKGMVAAQLNDDLLPDLVVVQRASNTVQVLLNQQGGFRNVQGAPIAVGADPTSVVAADFDGDRHMDLAVANLGSSTVSILRGQGDGTFATPATVATDSNPLAMTSADVDGDTDIDLVVTVATDRLDDPPITILRNDGRSVFTATAFSGAGDFPSPIAPLSLVAADFGGDGTVDIALADAAERTVEIWENLVVPTAHRVALLANASDAEVSVGIKMPIRTIDATDIDALAAALIAGDQSDVFDWNTDGVVDPDDQNYLITNVLGTQYGDIDLDGQVGFADFLVFAANFGARDVGWSQGDFFGDRQVGFRDFLLLANNFGFPELPSEVL